VFDLFYLIEIRHPAIACRVRVLLDPDMEAQTIEHLDDLVMICQTTKATVPTKPPIASVTASRPERRSRASFSTRIILSMFSATDAGALSFDASFMRGVRSRNRLRELL
jgi:hypothetical protein